MGVKCVNDKFYTKIQVAKECLDFLGDLSNYEKVVECSAGSGSFSRQINHTNLEAYDILPEDNSIIKQDTKSSKRKTLWHMNLRLFP